MNIAIIPARGGSKRIHRKNLKPFAGIPMILRAIAVARRSRLFSEIIVSTDDPEIASLALEEGAEVPFIRPERLSGDIVDTASVVRHAIQGYECNDLHKLLVCCIYPCTPFLETSDLTKALNILIESKEEFTYPVIEFEHTAYRGMVRSDSGKMQFLFPHHELTRTQDLEKTYHDAGQFYWGLATAWLEGKRMHTSGIGIPFPKYKYVDIDTVEDWEFAEKLYLGVSEA